MFSSLLASVLCVLVCTLCVCVGLHPVFLLVYTLCVGALVYTLCVCVLVYTLCVHVGLRPHSEHRFPAPSSKLCQIKLRH